MSLAEFLLARIAEDEARAHLGNGKVGWLTYRRADGSMKYTTVAHGELGAWMVDGREVVGTGGGINEFYDSARVLAECEAKRRIVEVHAGGHECPSGPGIEGVVAGWYEGEDTCSTLDLLAQPYSSHPDFDEEWAL